MKRNLRNVNKPIASSADESNANDPGSGTAEPPGPGPTPPPGRITPLLKPLVLCVQVSETTFGRPTVVAGLFPANVTEVSAKALPHVSCAPGRKLMFVSARIFPRNAVLSPRIAWLPITQYKPAAAAPTPPVVSVTKTEEPGAVVSVVPVSKIQSGVRLAPAARVSVPVNVADDVNV